MPMTLELIIHAAISLSKRKSPRPSPTLFSFVIVSPMLLMEATWTIAGQLCHQRCPGNVLEISLTWSSKNSSTKSERWESPLASAALVSSSRLWFTIFSSSRAASMASRQVPHSMLTWRGKETDQWSNMCFKSRGKSICNFVMEPPLYSNWHFFGHRFGDVLEDTAATSLALVSHQLHPVLPLLFRLLPKVGFQTIKISTNQKTLAKWATKPGRAWSSREK